MRNKRLIIISGAVLVVVIFVIIFLSIPKNSTDTNTVTDRDTGETISLEQDPGVSDGAAGEEFSSKFVPVFGLLDLIKELDGNTGKFTDDIKPALQGFVASRTNEKFSTVTVIPKDTKIKDSVISSSVRLGQGDEILPFTVRLSGNKKSSIVRVIDVEKKYGGDYVYIGAIENSTLLYTITLKHDYKDADDPIVITVDASMSYREAALDYIRSLGYTLSDFTIKFTNYENPFK